MFSFELNYRTEYEWDFNYYLFKFHRQVDQQINIDMVKFRQRITFK